MRGEQACLKQHCGANFFFLLHNSQYRFLAARPALGEMEKPAFGGLRSFTGNLPARNNKRDSDNGASRLNNSLCEGTGLIIRPVFPMHGASTTTSFHRRLPQLQIGRENTTLNIDFHPITKHIFWRDEADVN